MAPPVYHTAAAAGYDSGLDVFGDEENAQIRYRTLSWQLVSVLMIAEIVSNGMLSLPSSLAVVGIVPGAILIVFLGVFATFTSYLLIQFKLRHPEVHSMGDAGYIMFGPVGREVLATGTILFAICATGSQLLAGQIALSTLSDDRLCAISYTGIFAVVTFLFSLPRTLDHLSWLSLVSVVTFLIASIVGMVGAALYPVPDRQIDIALSSDFETAFISITNPVFAYAGHFMFFILISEMKDPRAAFKAAYTLQSFATTLYLVFAVVVYYYIGSRVASPAFSSLEPRWAQAAYGISLPNFVIGGSLYAHTAAKLVFVRLFRGTRHIHDHSVRGWTAWLLLAGAMTAAGFVLAVGVPIFNYLVGLVASLFAAWYTYGIVGMFWIYDAWWSTHTKGRRALQQHWPMTALSVATIVAGGFMCVAGLYAIIRGIQQAYLTGTVAAPFSC